MGTKSTICNLNRNRIAGILLASLIAFASMVYPRRASSAPRPATLPTAAAQNPSGHPTTQPNEDSWLGLYSSTTEIAGFTGTVLSIEQGLFKDLTYRMTFRSDVLD